MVSRDRWTMRFAQTSRAGRATVLSLLLCAGVALALLSANASSHASPAVNEPVAVSAPASPEDVQAFLGMYCVYCHNQAAMTTESLVPTSASLVARTGVAFDAVDLVDFGANPQLWERVVRKLRTGTMPPGNMPRPDEETYEAIATFLEGELDRAWSAKPYPGRINAVHRMNRTEYNNSVRDLLAIDVDVTDLLPGDETADGSFDNFADVLSITPAHMERYMSVARMVTRLAVGLPPSVPVVETTEVPLHIVQHDLRSTDLPLGSRGGVAFAYNFPADGEYVIKVRLRRQYQDYLMGMGWPQQFDVRVDGVLLQRFTVGGGALDFRPAAASYAGSGEPGSFGSPEWEEYMQLTGDQGLEVRAQVEAGPRTIGVAFVREMWEPEGLPQPLQRGRVLTNDQIYMDHASIHSVEVAGPYEISGRADDTPSRREIFVCQPEAGESAEVCASQILSRIAERAYRRPIVEEDVQELLGFFRLGEQGRDFDHGIQLALERVLVDPEFLLRVYRDPEQDGDVYRLSDLELASRLSFFLWSSIPDQTLLDLAKEGRLSDPQVWEAQIRRMLDEPRAPHAIVDGFAAQWLNMRRIPEKLADPDLYPDFDDNLLEAFQKETELLIAGTIEEDLSVLELLSADYTWANERLADFYGIPGVYGERFRKVSLPDPERRGGILGHGGLLAVTSYPDRTAPVLRGKWLVDNIMGAHFPPPPPNVDTSLEQGQEAVGLTIRERLDQHRQDALCASCHATLDPLGFALENFDATGSWRDYDANGEPVDNLGTWPGGRELNGVAGLRALLLDEYREEFVGTVTEKLMEYALGRKVEYYDRPAVRQIVREAAQNDYSWSSIVVGIAESVPFVMRARTLVD